MSGREEGREEDKSFAISEAQRSEKREERKKGFLDERGTCRKTNAEQEEGGQENLFFFLLHPSSSTLFVFLLPSLSDPIPSWKSPFLPLF